MPKLPSSFNREEHEQPDFEPIKAGRYIGRIVNSEMKECSPSAKDPDGEYLKLTFRIDEGQDFAGRQIWVNLNLINKNEQAVNIANAELARIVEAAGKDVIEDSDELHDIPMYLDVVVSKDNRGGDYPDTNRIKKYLPLKENKKKEKKSKNKKKSKGDKPWEE